MKIEHALGFLFILSINIFPSSIILCVKVSATNTKMKSDTSDNPQGLFIQTIAQILSTDLNNTVEDELGISVIADLYSKLKYVPESQDFEKFVTKIASKIGTKLNETFAVLYNIADAMNEYHSLGSVHLSSVIAPCTVDDSSISNRQSRNYEAVQQVLLKATDNYQSIKLKKHLKQVYFLSSLDVSSDWNSSTANGGTGSAEDITHECNRQNQSLLWSLFTNYHRSDGSNILLLLDHGGSLSKQQLRTVKELAQQLIDDLSPADRIGVVAISDSVQSATIPQEQCLAAPPTSDISESVDAYASTSFSSAQADRLESFRLWPATERHRRGLQQWIGALNTGASGTNHSLGLQWSLGALLAALTVNDTTPTVMVYVSRGLLASIADARPVLESVARGVEQLRLAGHGLMINTVAVIDESKPILFETQFLRDVAEQNYSQYNVESFSDPMKGSLLTLNSSQSVGLTVARLLRNIQQSTFEPNYGPRLSIPRWDGVSRDIAVSVTIPWNYSTTTYGVLGADLLFADLVEDVTYFGSNIEYSYAFIIDMSGLSVAHPSYQLPLSAFEQPRFVDIRHLEHVPDFNTVRNRMLTEFRGSHGLITTSNETIRYIWEQVNDWYAVCVVVHTDRPIPKHPYKVHWPYNNDNANQFLHYRLDLLPTEKLCLHLNQVATLDAGTLFLGASCFKSPFAYTQSLDQLQSSPQKIMAYLSDNTRLISNPGLREHVRDEVAALAIVLDYLRAQHLGGVRARYVVRRYVAGIGFGGVLLMYPGSALVAHFEPSRREWYRKALANPDSIVLTPPYLDAGGAGFIVTIARATEHAIVAMDVTLGYVYKVLLDAMPSCAGLVLKCFLMDEYGYLIYHPQLLDPNGLGPLERLHLIHKESFVASDLLGQHHRNAFVQKRLCIRYTDNTLQRYYQLNASVGFAQAQSHVHAHGGCTRYQVAALPITNAFVGIVNASCDLPPATFCPCSVVDRRCLNCNRMEQRECECPCECPLLGCGSSGADHSQLPACVPRPIPIHAIATFHHRPLPATFPIHQLRQCLPIVCDLLATYDACLGALGCEWCRYDVNGEPLVRTHPFCTALATCWGGVIGARPPLPGPAGTHHIMSMRPVLDMGTVNGSIASADLTGSSDLLAQQKASALAPATVTALPPAHYSPAGHYSPVGPIVGAVIGMCLILVVLFFCQRSYAAAAAVAMQAGNASSTLVATSADTDPNSHQPPSLYGGAGGSSGNCGGSNMRMSDLNLDDVGGRNRSSGRQPRERDRLRLLRADEEDEDQEDEVGDDDCGSCRDASGGQAQAHAVLSPYCVFSGYRRPAVATGTTGECSDHGYSTMTPHEHDSEHMSFAPYRIVSRSEPESESEAAGYLQFTALPNSRNCIIAPVTVHRNMEPTQI